MVESPLVEKLSGIAVFILALREGCIFPEDFLRKLDGMSLLQRAIETALAVGIEESNIHVLTDSEQAQLAAFRLNVSNSLLGADEQSSDAQRDALNDYIRRAEEGCNLSILLSVYAPLVKGSTLKRAARELARVDTEMVVPVRQENKITHSNQARSLSDLATRRSARKSRIECHAFRLFKPGVIFKQENDITTTSSFLVGDDALEIDSLQSWWVCEKLLQRKRIVFWVIGSREVGAGHIYRSLTLAHELTDHEVLFAMEPENQLATDQLAKSGYQTVVCPMERLLEEVIDLAPQLVVLDVLDTDSDVVLSLRKMGIQVASFEDLGDGSKHTSLTINELYDVPQLPGEHYRWGHPYFFVRDEFSSAKPIRFRERVQGLLLTFGGTDQHNLSREIFIRVWEICKKNDIHVYIVTGPGYQDFEDLRAELSDHSDVTLTHATGVISEVMEQCDVAITSNGRTVYELAHMNIPSIVVAQHDRELTHSFALKENGFVPLGLYQSEIREQRAVTEFVTLITNSDLRRMFHNRMKPHCFTKNKENVLDLIRNLLDTPAV